AALRRGRQRARRHRGDGAPARQPRPRSPANDPGGTDAMTLLPEVHESLARAVAARGARRPWWRSPRGIAWCAAGAVAAGGSALAASAGWHPILGDSHRGHPREARAPVPADQLAALAVLRRPQTDADRTRHVRFVLRLLVAGEISGVHVDAIRLLRTRPDG